MRHPTTRSGRAGSSAAAPVLRLFNPTLRTQEGEPSSGPTEQLRPDLITLEAWQAEARALLLTLFDASSPVAIPFATDDDATGAASPSKLPAELLEPASQLLEAVHQNTCALYSLHGRASRWAAVREVLEGLEHLLAVATAHGVPCEALSQEDLYVYLDAIYLLDGNTVYLRSLLEAALLAHPHAEPLAWRLALYELLAGRPDAAWQAIQRAPHYRPMATLRALLTPPPMRALSTRPSSGVIGGPALLYSLGPQDPFVPTHAIEIWQSYPCNYYTYRYSLISSQTIEDAIMVARGGTPPQLLPATGPSLMAVPEDYEPTEPNPVDPYSSPEIPPATPPDQGLPADQLTLHVMYCWQNWNTAMKDYMLEKYSSSIRYLEMAIRRVLSYLGMRYPDTYAAVLERLEYVEPVTLIEVHNFIMEMGEDLSIEITKIGQHFRERFRQTSLDELYRLDWIELAEYTPQQAGQPPTDFDIYRSDRGLLDAFIALESTDQQTKDNAELVLREKVDAPMLVMGMILIPIAIAEAARRARDYDTAVALCDRILVMNTEFHFLSPINRLIELLYIKTLYANVLMDKGNSQYKARELTNPEDPSQGLAAASRYETILALFSGEDDETSPPAWLDSWPRLVLPCGPNVPPWPFRSPIPCRGPGHLRQFLLPEPVLSVSGTCASSRVSNSRNPRGSLERNPEFLTLLGDILGVMRWDIGTER